MTEPTNTASNAWRTQVRRTVGLLVIWAVVGFGMSILGVEWLNGFTFNNMPFGFWMAQQGAVIIFVLLILTYAILSQDNRKPQTENRKPRSE